MSPDLVSRVAALEAIVNIQSDLLTEVRDDVKALLRRRKTPWAALATIVAAVATVVSGWLGVAHLTK